MRARERGIEILTAKGFQKKKKKIMLKARKRQLCIDRENKQTKKRNLL